MLHPKFHGIDRAETDRRTNIAIQELSRAGGPKGVTSRLMQEFDCSRNTAKRIMRRAKDSLKIDVPTVAGIERERVRRKINKMIEDEESTDTFRLAAIKVLIDLLGLAEPARTRLDLTVTPPDPIEAYRKNPDLLERALQLERDMYAPDTAVASLNTGAAGVSRLAVPSTPPEVGGNGHAAVDRSRLQPPGGADSG